MSEQHYIHGPDNHIVRLTGRKAQRNKSRNTRQRTQTEQSVDELVEITPVDSEIGRWTKWVRLQELYTIIEDNDANTR